MNESNSQADVGPDIRQDVLDWLNAENVEWNGRLPEIAFLERVVDLDLLPSTDPRFKSARADIQQHTISNDDWEPSWVYGYAPLNLVHGPVDRFERFVTQLIHPIVRPNSIEARQLASEINSLLAPARVRLIEATSIGDRPVWSFEPVRASNRGRRPVPSAPEDEQADGLWEPGYFRLFISHVSTHRSEVSALKVALLTVGVASFVAHEDIEPTLEWQAEIERALGSMDALLAVITEDFHASRWTDQEVGFALGRGRMVVPLRVPDNPYGLMGKFQGLRASLSDLDASAAQVVDVLLARSETRDSMRSGLIRALRAADSFAHAALVANRIAALTELTDAEKAVIREAFDENGQVADSFGARRLRAIVQQ